jgi:deazaflavin-dependent oxidoreductase (nitroreductase family)
VETEARPAKDEAGRIGLYIMRQVFRSVDPAVEESMNRAIRAMFRFVNRFWMVPVFRLGLGSLQVNPFSGYILVLKTTGRRTGKTRYVPVNYIVDGGSVYFLSGMGAHSHWYRNLKAAPKIDALLPGRTIHGKVAEIRSAAERVRLIRKILIAGGFAGFFAGFNPFTCTDKQLAEGSRPMTLFRLTPDGIGIGASDSGGWGWILIFFFTLVLCVGAVALLVAVR